MSKEPLHVIAVTCVIERNGKFLVVQRQPGEGEYEGKWVFPGGKVEDNENPIETLFREIKEEVGIEIGHKIGMIRMYKFRRKTGENTVGIVFVGKYLKGKVVLDNDLSSYRWVILEEFMKMNVIEGSDTHMKNAIMFLRNNLLVNKSLLTL